MCTRWKRHECNYNTQKAWQHLNTSEGKTGQKYHTYTAPYAACCSFNNSAADKDDTFCRCAFVSHLRPLQHLYNLSSIQRYNSQQEQIIIGVCNYIHSSVAPPELSTTPQRPTPFLRGETHIMRRMLGVQRARL